MNEYEQNSNTEKQSKEDDLESNLDALRRVTKELDEMGAYLDDLI